MLYKVPLVLEPQTEGGYTVTSPLLPELVTEGDTLDEALVNVKDALLAVIEAYEDLGKSLPRKCANRGWTGLAGDSGSCSLTYRDVVRRLSVVGCIELPRRGGGSHRKWFNPASGRSTVIPDWGGRDLKLGTVRAAVRQLGVDWEDFRDAL